MTTNTQTIPFHNLFNDTPNWAVVFGDKVEFFEKRPRAWEVFVNAKCCVEEYGLEFDARLMRAGQGDAGVDGPELAPLKLSLLHPSNIEQYINEIAASRGDM